MTLADTIRSALAKHLADGRAVLGQNIGTTGESVCVPPGAAELPTSDCSNSGVVCGYALAGRKPCYVIRYAPFGWYNLCSIVNYAAKSSAIWKTPCPIFVRGIASEGSVGPVASGPMHSQVMRMPGIRVYAPMTPAEWTEAWEWFLTHDEPVYCSEQRASWKVDGPRHPRVGCFADVSIVGIGGTAWWNAFQASLVCSCDCLYAYRLKPLAVEGVESLRSRVLVVDSDYPTCGAAEHVAQRLHELTGARVWTLGLEDRTAGFSAATDNLTPTAEQIVAKVREIAAA